MGTRIALRCPLAKPPLRKGQRGWIAVPRGLALRQRARVPLALHARLTDRTSRHLTSRINKERSYAFYPTRLCNPLPSIPDTPNMYGKQDYRARHG